MGVTGTLVESSPRTMESLVKGVNLSNEERTVKVGYGFDEGERGGDDQKEESLRLGEMTRRRSP